MLEVLLCQEDPSEDPQTKRERGHFFQSMNCLCVAVMDSRPLESGDPFELHDGGLERVSDSIGGGGQCQLLLDVDLSAVVVAVDNSLVDKLAELGTEAGTDR